MDASWILGPENVKKGQAAAGVDSGMDGLMVFCWKITPDLVPRMLWGGVVMSSGSCSHGDGSKWNPERRPGLQQDALLLGDAPVEPTVGSSSRNALPDPAQAGC